jgi:hypothetical protein
MIKVFLITENRVHGGVAGVPSDGSSFSVRTLKNCSTASGVSVYCSCYPLVKACGHTFLVTLSLKAVWYFFIRLCQMVLYFRDLKFGLNLLFFYTWDLIAPEKSIFHPLSRKYYQILPLAEIFFTSLPTIALAGSVFLSG